MPEHSQAPSPQAWLWAEIARRFGDEAAAALHDEYMAVFRVYNRRRHHEPPDPTPAQPRRQKRRPRKPT